MIYSMTAFSRVQSVGEWGSLTCEIRSINHRYLELSVNLPESLRSLEMAIREKLRHALKRGKVECIVRYQQTAAVNKQSVKINEELAQALSKASEKIAAYLRTPAAVDAASILKMPGVIETEEADMSLLGKAVNALIEKAANDLIAARGREGNELTQLFLGRIAEIEKELAKVRKALPDVISNQQARLQKRFDDAKLELDPTRLEQEMLFYVQRIDVTEEVERTETHLAEVNRILKEGGLVGRRLDFLMQELNREANTLGSKSTDPTITHAAVEMKVLIEQMREQVQNIE